MTLTDWGHGFVWGCLAGAVALVVLFAVAASLYLAAIETDE